MMWPFYFCPFVNYFYTRHVIALSVDTLFHFHSLFNSILCPKKIQKKVIFTSQIVCVCIFSFDILRFLLFLSVCLSILILLCPLILTLIWIDRSMIENGFILVSNYTKKYKKEKKRKKNVCVCRLDGGIFAASQHKLNDFDFLSSLCAVHFISNYPLKIINIHLFIFILDRFVYPSFVCFFQCSIAVSFITF